MHPPGLRISTRLNGIAALLLLPALLSAAEPAKNPVAVPSADEVTRLLAAGPAGHPRLFVDAAAFARISTATDPAVMALRGAVMAQALAQLDKPVATRQLDGRRLLRVSREVLGRLGCLSAAWRMTGERRYATRVSAELRAVCDFTDWNPAHFLDVAEMTLGVAVAYDWCFDALDANTRTAVRRALIDKGLDPSFAPGTGWWVIGENNWNQVCHGAMIAGALALGDTDPTWAVRVIPRALANLPRSLRASYAPDGAYPEGPSYWSYGTAYTAVAIDALRHGLGSDFGLAQMPGFTRTAEYIVHARGPTGLSYNYSDGYAEAEHLDPARIWLAREVGIGWKMPGGSDPLTDPGLQQERLLFLALAWAPASQGPTHPRSLDFRAGGQKPVATFRSAWDDPLAVYLATCGGSASTNHGHMDAGSFVFEADGVRWALDLGADDYNRLETKGIDLWNSKQDSQRWTVFRLGLRGHGTLVFGNGQQQVKGMAPITAFSANERTPGCTIDLSQVYAGQAKQVGRTFSLPERNRLVVTDRITGVAAPGVVRWQLVTRAAVTIDDGGYRATLRQSGKSLALVIVSPPDARLVATPADPPNAFDSPNPGISIIAAEVTARAGQDLEYQIGLWPGG